MTKLDWMPERNLWLAQEGKAERLHLATLAYVDLKFVHKKPEKASLLEDILMSDDVNPDLIKDTESFQRPFPEKYREDTLSFHNRTYEMLYEISSLFEVLGGSYHKKNKIAMTPNFAAGVLGRHGSTTRSLMKDLSHDLDLPFKIKELKRPLKEPDEDRKEKIDFYNFLGRYGFEKEFDENGIRIRLMYVSTDESRFAGTKFREEKKAYKSLRGFRKEFKSKVKYSFGKEGVRIIDSIDDKIQQRTENLCKKGLITNLKGEARAKNITPQFYHIVGETSASYQSIGPPIKEVDSFPKNVKFWGQELEPTIKKRLSYGRPDKIIIGEIQQYAGEIDGMEIHDFAKQEDKILVRPIGLVKLKPYRNSFLEK